MQHLLFSLQCRHQLMLALAEYLTQSRALFGFWSADQHASFPYLVPNQTLSLLWALQAV